ncbi:MULTISPECIES: hypothetical protein [unclassified Streptomyces]|uniref:hypothetical protein n=1 Tax=unclassified Streptomyces TaxID=2593676 RepID=UPI0033908D90
MSGSRRRVAFRSPSTVSMPVTGAEGSAVAAVNTWSSLWTTRRTMTGSNRSAA